MKTARMFTLTFTLGLMLIVSLLTTTGAAHAATRQENSSSTQSSSCFVGPLTFPFYTSSSHTYLELTRPSDGTKILLAVTTTPDELRLGMGELYV